jgi:shikimate kinase
MRIYLVGFMGSGKSTLGQRIASAFQVSCFDTDRVVESQAGMTISDIFNSRGEDYFRHLETDVLKQTAFYEKSIIATGGGMPCFGDNMHWMKEKGITMFLDWPEPIITKQLLKERASRPLLATLTDTDARIKIKDLLQLRRPIYEQAAITLEMQGDEESDFRLLEKACKYIW